jgi:hypothetical protein
VLDNCERREDISSRYARSFAFAGGAPVDIVIPIKPLVYQDTCVEDIKSAHTIRDNGFRHTLISSGLNHLHSLKNPVRLLSNPLLYIRNVVNQLPKNLHIHLIARTRPLSSIAHHSVCSSSSRCHAIRVRILPHRLRETVTRVSQSETRYCAVKRVRVVGAVKPVGGWVLGVLGSQRRLLFLRLLL